MKKFKLLLLSVFVALGTSTIQAQSQKIDIKKSTITWIGKKVTGEHKGTINFQDGTVAFKKGKLVGGNFTVDMPSLVCNDLSGEWKQKLEGHLKSEDFFGTEKFKNSTLVFKKIVAKDKENYTVTADLTIKGITKPITFNMAVKGNSAKADLKIDRTKYDIKYGSGSFFDDLGDKTIYDDFELMVTLKF